MHRMTGKLKRHRSAAKRALYCAWPLMDGLDLRSAAMTPATMSSMNVKSRDSSVSFGPCNDQRLCVTQARCT